MIFDHSFVTSPYLSPGQKIWNSPEHPLHDYTGFRAPLEKSSFFHREGELVAREFDHHWIEKWIRHDMASLSLTAAQEHGLHKLRQAKSAIILTGQQPGLLTGPMYTLYKALTTVELAKKVEEKFGIPMIPVFWIADDDSDFAEVNLVEFWDTEKPISARRFGSGMRNQDLCLSHRPLGSEVKNLEWPKLPESYAGILTECLNEKLDYGASFLHLMQHILSNTGLLFVRGSSPIYRKAAAPYLQDSLDRFVDLDHAERETVHQLQKHHIAPPIPVKPNQSHVFYLEDGKRHRIYRQNQNWVYASASGGFKYLPSNAVKDGHLSHDVLTRLMVTERILPVYATVLGPGELTYYLQVAPILNKMGYGVPLVQPRATVAFLPQVFVEDLFKLGIDPNSAIQMGVQGIEQKAQERLWQKKHIPENFLNDALNQWQIQMSLTLPPEIELGKHFSRSLHSVWDKWVALQKKNLYQSQKLLHPRWQARLGWLASGVYQDRHLNYFSLRSALGALPWEKFTQSIHFLDERPQWIWPQIH